MVGNEAAEGGEQEPLGLLYTWWRGDPLPELGRVPGLAIERLDVEDSQRADIALEADERLIRLGQGHDLYVARMEGQTVAWGWSASLSAHIGELGINMTMPPANRYLWDFVTLPEWRGQGVYGHLLQAMLQGQPDVDRFWVGHDYDNTASGRGILRAGFALVVELYEDESGFYLLPVSLPERAGIAADLLGVPVRDTA